MNLLSSYIGEMTWGNLTFGVANSVAHTLKLELCPLRDSPADGRVTPV